MGAAGRGASDSDLGTVGSVKSSPPRPAAAMALSGFLWQHRGRGLGGAGLRRGWGFGAGALGLAGPPVWGPAAPGWRTRFPGLTEDSVPGA